jgi:hypothetical protein
MYSISRAHTYLYKQERASSQPTRPVVKKTEVYQQKSANPAVQTKPLLSAYLCHRNTDSSTNCADIVEEQRKPIAGNSRTLHSAWSVLLLWYGPVYLHSLCHFMCVCTCMHICMYSCIYLCLLRECFDLQSTIGRRIHVREAK